MRTESCRISRSRNTPALQVFSLDLYRIVGVAAIGQTLCSAIDGFEIEGLNPDLFPGKTAYDEEGRADY